MPCPNASHPRTGYDPRQHGADCDSCILGPNSALLPKGSLWLPVQPELRPGADILIVGRNPAERESDLGHPQVGSGGIELTAQLDAAGMPRAPTPLVRRPDGSPWPGVSLDNVIKCNPDIDGRGPKGAFERMTARWRSINARLKKKGLPPLKHPSECCRPTLDASLATAANVVVLGGEPLKAVTGTNAGIGSKKGGIWRQRVAGPKAGVDGSPPDAWLKLGATYDPSYVSGSPGERAGVIADLAKFRRFFEDRLHWVEPGILFNPMVSEALAFLDSCAAQPRFFYDMETDAKEPLTARTRCIGFGYRHPMRRTACWACNDRHTDNPQKVAFLAGLLESRGKTHAGSPCIVCDGSGYYETDFSCLLLTFTSVWPQTKLWHDKGVESPNQAAGEDDNSEVKTGQLAGLFYTHAELKQLIAGVNKLFKAAEQARPKAVAGHRQPDGSFDTADGCVAIGHNANSYDRQAIESSPWRPHHFTNRSADGSLSGFVFSVAIDYAEDTLVDTRYVNPEGQKGLAAVGARFEDVTVWKEDHDGNKTAIGSKNDWELGIYCCFDVTVDGRAEAKMKEYVNTAGGFNEIALRPMGQPLARLLVEVDPYRVDLRAQYRHVGMHRVGVHVNQERRLLFQRVLDSQAAWHLKQFNTIAQADIKLGDIKTEDDLVDDSGAESDGVLLPFDVSTYDPAEEIRRMMSGEADAPSVNINSVNQLRTLIYEKWGIEKPQILDAHEFYTATGLASVGDNVLRAICADSKTPKKVAVALHHLRMAKRYRWKLSVTTLGPLSRGVKEAVDWKGSEAAAAGIRPAGSEERGYIWPDGCVRPSWSSRTAVWRDDCSEPNMMNIGSRKGGIRVEPYSPEGCKRIRERGGVIVDSLPERAADYAEVWQQIVRSYTRPGVSFEDAEWQVIQLACRNLSPGGGVFKGKLKSVFDAKPGMCLIGGDMDQLHLRIIANLYGIPVLLDAFEKGQDPHNALAYAVFGHRFVNADGWGPGGFTLYKKPYGGAALQMREAMKTFRYAIIYGAVSGTAWRVYVAVENDTGGLPNAGTEKTEIDNYYEAWRAAEPQWKDQFWDVTLAQYRDNALRDTGFEGGVGYLIEPVTGTRSGALEGGALCATANWTVLRVEAIIVRMAEANLSQLYPYKASALLGKRGANLGGYYGRYGRPDAGSIWDIGLNMNVHDFLSAQIVDESDGAANIGTTKWGKARLAETREALTIKLPGHPVAYSCDPGIGRGLHEV